MWLLKDNSTGKMPEFKIIINMLLIHLTKPQGFYMPLCPQSKKTGISNACNTPRTNSDTPYLCSHIEEAIAIKLNIRACLDQKSAACLLYFIYIVTHSNSCRSRQTVYILRFECFHGRSQKAPYRTPTHSNSAESSSAGGISREQGWGTESPPSLMPTLGDQPRACLFFWAAK